MCLNVQSKTRLYFAVIIMALASSKLTSANDWRGNITIETRSFFEAATSSRQSDSNVSAFAEIEYYHTLDNGIDNIVATPFVRVDESDDERSHADFRELAWLRYEDNYELRVGLGKVFWGVAESRHLVDIVNQTDAVENTDGEDKLGQPMVNFSYLTDENGTLDFFVLPYFRERTFASLDGRPSLPVRVDIDNPVYQSSKKEEHIDYALRWSHTIDIWDVGLSYFDGTAREPRLVAALDNNNLPVLIPHYDQIAQTGIDIQATTEEWLWKLEAIYVDTSVQGHYTAAVGGFEYTFVGVFDSDADIGVIGEYLYDRRETSQAFQNDMLVGLRLALNDEPSTEVLFGVIQDLDGGARAFNLEASRRIGESYKITAEMRVISDESKDDVLSAAGNDDFLQLELGYYF